MSEPAPTIQTTLEKTLIDSIEGIKKTGTELVDALYQQAPEVIEQLLMWHGVESLIQFVIGLLLLTAPFWFYKIAKAIYIKLEVSKCDDQFNFWFPTVMIGASIAILVTIMVESLLNLTWLKIWLAPKVYLLEYLSNFVK